MMKKVTVTEKDRKMFKYQVWATVAISLGGGALLELGHPVGWSLLFLSSLMGLECLVEEVRQELF